VAAGFPAADAGRGEPAGLSYGFLQPPDGPYHRAGVSDGLDHLGIGLDEELRRIATAGLAYEPGTRWGYSIATDVLGAVIEKAAGEPLPNAMQRLVTAPLAMIDTGFITSDSPPVAVPYADGKPEAVRMADLQLVRFRGPGVIRFSPSRAFDRTAFPSGGAGMVGTAGDLVRLLETLRTGGRPILTPSAVQLQFAHRGCLKNRFANGADTVKNARTVHVSMTEILSQRRQGQPSISPSRRYFSAASLHQRRPGDLR
jgi:CubicO group peptidase (beta-lactamase class C family)